MKTAQAIFHNSYYNLITVVLGLHWSETDVYYDYDYYYLFGKGMPKSV